MNTQSKVLLAVLVIITGLSPVLLAQSADGDANKPATSEAPAVATSTDNPSAEAKSNQTSKEKSKNAKDGAFIPSEEISEDFAVSFPVDI